VPLVARLPLPAAALKLPAGRPLSRHGRSHPPRGPGRGPGSGRARALRRHQLGTPRAGARRGDAAPARRAGNAAPAAALQSPAAARLRLERDPARHHRLHPRRAGDPPLPPADPRFRARAPRPGAARHRGPLRHRQRRHHRLLAGQRPRPLALPPPRPRARPPGGAAPEGERHRAVGGRLRTRGAFLRVRGRRAQGRHHLESVGREQRHHPALSPARRVLSLGAGARRGGAAVVAGATGSRARLHGGRRPAAGGAPIR